MGGFRDRSRGDADGEPGEVSVQHEVRSQQAASHSESHQQSEGEFTR